MNYLDEMAKYQEAKKQKSFSANFLDINEIKEFWDEIEIGKESVVPAKYKVEAEDLIGYAKGVPDTNPIFYDDEHARKCGFPGIVAHPIFICQVFFYLLKGGHGSWIRTPGARNPGQVYEWYDPIKVGDILTLKIKGYDKWIKRGKYYMRYLAELYDQHDKLKLRSFATLILPRTKEDVLKFLKGERGLKA